MSLHQKCVNTIMHGYYYIFLKHENDSEKKRKKRQGEKRKKRQEKKKSKAELIAKKLPFKFGKYLFLFQLEFI